MVHLWGWEKQTRALGIMSGFLNSAAEPVLAGRGSTYLSLGGMQTSFYRHNEESFGRLFREISKVFVGWEVEVEVEAPAWEEPLKIRTAEEPVTTWDLHIKCVGRHRKGKTGD